MTLTPKCRVQSLVCSVFSAVLALQGAGCGSSSAETPSSTAAAVQGEADMHCTVGGNEIKAEIGMCVAPGSGADDASASEPDGGAGGGSDLGETLDNAEGEDDDCKYHVAWKSSEVKKGVGVTFDVTVTRRIDGKPATDADVELEAFLDDTHPSPSNNIETKELAGGVYRVGPVTFDAAGKWTIRFHFYELCSDAPEDSPHGHVAFFVNVP